MVHIHITTFVQAPVQRVFDLARHFTVLKYALRDTPAGVSSGAANELFAAGDTVTFQSRNLGKTRTVTARITEMDGRTRFTEEQVKGDLGSYRHTHHFMPTDNGTIMIDMIDCERPRDFLGNIAGEGALQRYVKKIVGRRISEIRQYAESEKWKAVLITQR